MTNTSIAQADLPSADFLNVQNSEVNATSWAPGQVNITNGTYDSIVYDQLTELWTNYGAMTEFVYARANKALEPRGCHMGSHLAQNILLSYIRDTLTLLPIAVRLWFDGGYSATQKGKISSLLQKLQPQAVIFNGCDTNGSCVSPNSIRWIGNEYGHAPEENWSTGVSNDGGHPHSPYFCPAECDTTLQQKDRWFWGQHSRLRSIEEMIDVYHKTVGRNCILELDLSPDRSGLIPAEYAARYKQLGDFIRSCYGTPIPHGSTSINSEAGVYSMTFDYPTAIDRIVLMENQIRGQVIRAYEVYAKIVDPTGANGTLDVSFTIVSNGTSIG